MESSILIGIILFCASMIPVAFFAARDSGRLKRNRNTPIESVVVGMTEEGATKVASDSGFTVRVVSDSAPLTTEFEEHRLNIRNQDGYVVTAWLG